MITSGRSAASSASSISYSGAPAASFARTRASISALDPVTSKVGWLKTGRRVTQLG